MLLDRCLRRGEGDRARGGDSCWDSRSDDVVRLVGDLDRRGFVVADVRCRPRGGGEERRERLGLFFMFGLLRVRCRVGLVAREGGETESPLYCCCGLEGDLDR